MGQADAGAPPALAGPLPPAPGVHRLRDQRARVRCIGRAVNLRRQVASYWGGLGARGADDLRGWNRDTARTRGIGAGDRAALTEELTAFLERDAEAVAWFRAELVRRRHAAQLDRARSRGPAKR